jgi:L-alanine exporter
MRRYLADTSALLVWSTFAGLFIEIVIAGLAVEQSLYARLTALPVTLITARPYGLYRDWIWRAWRADEGAARRLIVDTAALISFQLPLYWMILAFVGATLWQIAAASVTAIVVLAVSGRPYGVLLDAFRRLFGVTPRAERLAPHP